MKIRKQKKYNEFTWVVGEPEIGERVWIGAFTLIDALYAPLKIGRGANISSGAQILTHSTVKRCVSEWRFGEVDSKPTEIGEFCFIGTNAVILMGSIIGHHSVVAAGAVVPENSKFPPYSLITGLPAKRIGSSRKYLRGIEKESISITIPAFNEVKTVEKVVADAIKEVSRITKDFEILLVDDGSTDGTKKVIKRLAKRKNVRAIYHRENRGFTGAMKSCLYNAKKNLIFLAPSDGQFDFRQLNKFVEAIKGNDGVIGYKKNNEEGIIRKVNSWVFHSLCKLLLKIPFKEISSVFLWRRGVVESIRVTSEDKSAGFLPEFFAKAIRKNYKFVEIPINWKKRKGGKAKGVNPLMIIKTFTKIVGLWWELH